MNGFEEFMAFIAKRAEKKNETPEMGGKSSDGKEIDPNLADRVLMILSGCDMARLKRLEQFDFFKRLTENFIKANTKEDIKQFVTHNVALKMTNILMR